MATVGRITGWVALTVLLAAYESPGFAQEMPNQMSDTADRLKAELAGEAVTVGYHGPVTLTSGADAMFSSGGWELNPGVPVLSKIVPTLAKLQHTERWLAKFGQVDKWSFCLRAASMPRIRSDHDETSPPDPRTGIQG